MPSHTVGPLVPQLAILQELEDIISKETYHVLPIMESRQGFTNLTANVQRISQVGAGCGRRSGAGVALRLCWSRSCVVLDRARRGGLVPELPPGAAGGAGCGRRIGGRAAEAAS